MANEEYTKLATIEYFGPIQNEPGWCLLIISSQNQVVRSESLRFLRSLPEAMSHKASKKDKGGRWVWAIHQQLMPLVGRYFLVEEWIAGRLRAQRIAEIQGRQAVETISDYIETVRKRHKIS